MLASGAWTFSLQDVSNMFLLVVSPPPPRPNLWNFAIAAWMDKDTCASHDAFIGSKIALFLRENAFRITHAELNMFDSSTRSPK